MCLEYAVTPKSKTGYGYKVVKILPDGRYQNYYGDVYTKTTYEIGVSVTVTKRKRTDALATYSARYTVGIHLYIEPVDSREEPHFDGYIRRFSSVVGNNARYRNGIALLLCKYERAVAQDGEQVVARKVTPIKELARYPAL